MKRAISRAAALVLTLAAAEAMAQAAAPVKPNPWWNRYVAESARVSLPDGRRINLYCEGRGAPLVVLDSGLGDGAWGWRTVQDRIARTTRVCSYDRAGIGKSDPNPAPHDLKAAAADLEAALAAAKEAGPYVLVGHSAAGMTVRYYAAVHPGEVVGLVLVDPSSEGQIARLAAAAPGMMKLQDAQGKAGAACAKPGRPAVLDAICVRKTADQPPELAGWWARMQGPGYYQAMLAELEAFQTLNSEELVAVRRPFGDLPVRMLTNAGFAAPGVDPAELAAADKAWRDMHTETMQGSTHGRGLHRVVAGAGHYIQGDKPDAVVEAVDEVVKMARTASPPAKRRARG